MTRAEFGAKLESLGQIHAQHDHRSSADRRQTSNPHAVGTKMLFPRVGARIEKQRDLPCPRVDPGEVCALVGIAVLARQGEVVWRVASPVLSWNDMLDVKGDKRRLRLLGSGERNVRVPIRGQHSIHERFRL